MDAASTWAAQRSKAPDIRGEVADAASVEAAGFLDDALTTEAWILATSGRRAGMSRLQSRVRGPFELVDSERGNADP